MQMMPWTRASRQCKLHHLRVPPHIPYTHADYYSNAIILSTFISAIYILLGNMRLLLTLNGLSEYSFFFLTVLGAIILRWREPTLHRPVKPFVFIPALFAVISGFVVVRGAIFAPVQAVVLVLIWMVGILYYYMRKWWFRMEHGEALNET